MGEAFNQRSTEISRKKIGAHRESHVELARGYPDYLSQNDPPSVRSFQVLPRHLTLLSLRGNPWCRG